MQPTPNSLIGLVAALILAAGPTRAAQSTLGPPLHLPLTFGPQFQDDPQRRSSAALPLAGAIAEGSGGLICYRSGHMLMIRDHRRNQSVDFSPIVRDAVKAAGIAPTDWDGVWDSSPGTDDRVAIDKAGEAFTVVVPRSSHYLHALLFHSADRCRTWRAVELSGLSASVESRNRQDCVVDDDHQRHLLGFLG